MCNPTHTFFFFRHPFESLSSSVLSNRCFIYIFQFLTKYCSIGDKECDMSLYGILCPIFLLVAKKERKESKGQEREGKGKAGKARGGKES